MLWVKAFHIIFMVAWYAGLLYLPRLFVYHSMTEDVAGHERFCVMERKLFAIMTIGAIGAMVFGLWMLVSYAWEAYASMWWLHAKLALVAGLIGFHAYCGKIMKTLRERTNTHGDTFFRWLNEIPAVGLIAIVILVIVKP